MGKTQDIPQTGGFMTTETNAQTPRTDAILKLQPNGGFGLEKSQCIAQWYDLASQLERELTAAESALEGARKGEAFAERVAIAKQREIDALQSRLDAAERDAGRLDWLVKMRATVYAAFEVGETMVQHWVTVDERGKERHGCVAETLRESIDKAIAEQPNLIDAFNGRAPFPDIAALSASAESEDKGDKHD